jgi:hypothetical protein
MGTPRLAGVDDLAPTSDVLNPVVFIKCIKLWSLSYMREWWEGGQNDVKDMGAASGIRP